jgi:hypothetical protein
MQLQLNEKPDPELQSLSAVKFLQKLRDQKYGKRRDSVLNKHFFRKFSSTTYAQSSNDTAGVTETIIINDSEALKTTTFVDAKESKMATLTSSSTLMNYFPKTPSSTIADFLARPTLAYDGDITAVTTLGLVTAIAMDAALFSPMYADKLKGIYALNYTTVVTLKINATRFQAGTLLLGFRPSGGATAVQAGIRNNINLTTKNQYSQLLHVKADFATDSSVTLRIPWMSAYQMQTLGATSTGSPGAFVLYLYAALNFLTGSNSVPITMYVHYEDVNLYGSVIPQGNMELDAVPQAGGTISRVKKRDIHTSEMLSDRPISTALGVIGKAGSALSGIPLLSTIAAPVGWIADALSNAAYLWGYSNPILIEPPMRAITASNFNMCNFDSKPPSQPLSLSISNSVSKLTNFASTDQDEMSIDFLKRRWGWYRTFTWTTAQTDGTILTNLDMRPNQYSTPGLTALTRSFTPLGFVSLLGLKWTGGLEFKFILSKTAFHAGRLAFVFTPSVGYSSPSPTLANIEYALKTIVDISDCNEIVIHVPFTAIQHWLSVDLTMGNLNVLVIDRLIAPGDVGTFIDINVEVRGAPDFQMAVPSVLSKRPAVAQADMSLGDEVITQAVGDSQMALKSYNSNAMCIGETFESVKCLLNSFKSFGPRLTMTNILGYYITPTALSYIDADGVQVNTDRDYYGMISLCYSLVRGGTALALPHVASNILDLMQVTAEYVETPIVGTSSSFAYNAGTFQSTANVSPSVVFKETDPVPNVLLPQYSINPSTPVSDNLVAANGLVTNNAFRGPAVVVMKNSAGNTTMFPRRAAADDFQLGGFFTIPLLN